MHTSTAKPLFASALIICALTLPACGTASDGAGNPDSNLSVKQATEPLQGASPALASIRQDANEVLPGGKDAFEARLAELSADGIPVVVNKWASWCGPCRLEFPEFQRAASRDATRIAFLGVNANDNDAAARTFLTELPLPFPSYSDPGQDIAAFIGAPQNFPSTAFYDSSGDRVYVKPGAYTSQAELNSDIAQYAK